MSWAVHVARIGGEERSIHVLLAACNFNFSCQCTSYSPDDSLFKPKHVAYCKLYLEFGVTTWKKEVISSSLTQRSCLTSK